MKQIFQYKDEKSDKFWTIETTGNDHYEFSEDHFADAGEFSAFEKIMDERCINITNR